MVLAQCTRLVAIMLKRGWLQQPPDAGGAFFNSLEERVVALNSAAARRTGLEVLEVGQPKGPKDPTPPATW